MTLRRVGFVGLGNMGQHMAMNLLRAGHSLVVHDLDVDAGSELQAEGAVWGSTPGELATSVDVVFTALPGPRELDQVVLGESGVLSGASEGLLLVDVGTTSPATIRLIGEVAAGQGVHVLDAPLSGGVRGARKGTLTIMVGGEEEPFRACEPLFHVLGESIVHLGPLGSGQVAKIVNNYMGLSNALASMEAMALGVGAGLDPVSMLEVIERSTGASYMTKTLFPYLILKRSFEPVRFSIDLAAKDLELALELAEELGGDVTVGSAALQALTRASADGMGRRDLSEYITRLERMVGAEVRPGTRTTILDDGHRAPVEGSDRSKEGQS